MTIKDDLLLRVRRLDETALAQVYDDHSGEIYRYAYRQLGDRAQAEDCVADTFSRFLQAVHRGAGPGSNLRAYLFRIAHNWITDRYRLQRPELLPLEHGQLASEEPGPARQYQIRMEQGSLREALRELTPDQRQVIALKFLEGWSHAEIAETMEKTTGAVKALQHRGIASLRRAITGTMEGLQ